MNHVKQKHSRGCGPAALAMLTGLAYDQVCQDFGLNFEVEGVDYRRADAWLIEQGYAIARIYKNDFRHQPRSQWPPKPFCSSHLCNVEVHATAPVSHFVVMLASGEVLDPLSDVTKTLADYHAVHNVAGVYRVA